MKHDFEENSIRMALACMWWIVACCFCNAKCGRVDLFLTRWRRLVAARDVSFSMKCFRLAHCEADKTKTTINCMYYCVFLFAGGGEERIAKTNASLSTCWRHCFVVAAARCWKFNRPLSSRRWRKFKRWKQQLIRCIVVLLFFAWRKRDNKSWDWMERFVDAVAARVVLWWHPAPVFNRTLSSSSHQRKNKRNKHNNQSCVLWCCGFVSVQVLRAFICRVLAPVCIAWRRRRAAASSQHNVLLAVPFSIQQMQW